METKNLSEQSFLKAQATLYAFARNADKYSQLLTERMVGYTHEALECENSDEEMFGLSCGSVRERFGNNLILSLTHGDKTELDAFTCEADNVKFEFEMSFKSEYTFMALTRDGSPFGENAEFLLNFTRTFFDKGAYASGAHCAEITINGETEYVRYPETTAIGTCEETPEEYAARKARERAENPFAEGMKALARLFGIDPDNPGLGDWGDSEDDEDGGEEATDGSDSGEEDSSGPSSEEGDGEEAGS